MSMTPREIVDKLALAVRRTLEMPALRERLAGLDVVPMPMSPAEFDAFVRQEIVTNAALAKAARDGYTLLAASSDMLVNNTATFNTDGTASSRSIFTALLTMSTSQAV